MTTLVSRRGLKRTCQDNDCGVRFYDLNKTTITCPVCGAGFTAPPLPVPRDVASKSASQSRPFAQSYGRLGRSAAVLPGPNAATSDAEEIADDVADEVADISIEVDDTIADKADAILELDDEVEDAAPIVETDNDSP